MTKTEIELNFEIKLFLVLNSAEVPMAAYPRKVQAEVYASGLSKPGQIIPGKFIAETDRKIVEVNHDGSRDHQAQD